MKQSRLSLVLEDNPELPAEGRILVVGAPADIDLSFLASDRLTLVQGFRPDHERLAARGYRVTPEAEGADYAAAIVLLPRARDAGRARVALACRLCRPGAPVWIDGQKTDGIDTMLRDLRARTEVSEPQSKAHGKIFRITADAGLLTGWEARDLVPAEGFVTRPGMFSAEAVDRGSMLLAAALPAGLSGRGADLGAGWGWLSAQVLSRPGVRLLHLVEAEHEALACARANVTDPRAEFHWADATAFKAPTTLDWVVMNPPFHQGRAADPALGAAFITAAAALLSPQGELWMVANRHLPYESVLAARFRDVSEVSAEAGFKIIRASHPLAKARGANRGAASAPAVRRGAARGRR